jgi:hypothetical protein
MWTNDDDNFENRCAPQRAISDKRVIRFSVLDRRLALMRPRELSVFVFTLLLLGSSCAWNTLPRASRRDLFQKLTNVGCVMASTTVLSPSANAVYSDPKTGMRFPDEGEISLAIPTDWAGVENPLDGDEKNQLSRLDKTPDSEFYSEPRFVEHVDDNAVKLMTEYITTKAVKTGDSVLDLCSSWTSHFGYQPSTAETNGRVRHEFQGTCCKPVAYRVDCFGFECKSRTSLRRCELLGRIMPAQHRLSFSAFGRFEGCQSRSSAWRTSVCSILQSICSSKKP